MELLALFVANKNAFYRYMNVTIFDYVLSINADRAILRPILQMIHKLIIKSCKKMLIFFKDNTYIMSKFCTHQDRRSEHMQTFGLIGSLDLKLTLNVREPS